MATIALVVEPFAIEEAQRYADAVVPVIDGASLIDRVGDFETRAGMDVPGGYAGLVPAHFSFGPAHDHYLGRTRGSVVSPGKVALLGCSCGDVGCWPLGARVDVSDDAVVWSHFEQPHRDSRDYSGFGPFVFARDEYEAAVAAIGEAWEA